MSLPYASTSPGVLAFIAQENINRPVSSSDPFTPQQVKNGIAGTTTDNVVGLASIAAGAAPVSLGSGFNTIILKGAHSTTAAAAGQPDTFSFNVDGTGLVTLLDNNSGQSETINGPAFVVFNDAATNASSTFESIYYIGNANQSEIVRLYNSALGRQPDLGGVEYYSNQLKAGFSFINIANEFMASPEFQADFGINTTDTQFINALYANVLHRTPSASEVLYYQGFLSQYEANPATGWSRAQELLNFTNSPECQQNVSGFVINTANGGYLDSTVPLSTQTVVNQAAQSGYLNTGLILTAPAIGTSVSASGFTVDGAGAAGADANYLPAFASANGANQTIVLSSTITWGWGDGSTTIYSSASGGDVFVVGKGGDTFFLSGTNNSVVVPNSGVGPTSVVSAATVYGFTDTDHLALGDWSHGSNLSQNATILTPSSSTPINGNNLSWVETLGTLGSYPVYAINVGKVQDDSAATMAAAANKVYSVADLDATFSGSGITQAEGITFIGTDPSGNTVAYGWYNPNTEKGADSNSNHLVDAAEFQGGAILVGVTASNVHASWFN